MEIMKQMTKFKFVGRISAMGQNKIIWIPKEFHEAVAKLEGKQIRIVLDDEI
jgi:hypothetical protein